MIRSLLNSRLYLPSRSIGETPAAAGLAFRDLPIETEDGERLHSWWIAAQAPRLGHVLLCHGNAGNVGDRVAHASLLSTVGFDVLLFDYRGYGWSTGRPSEEGTYRDARAARSTLLRQNEVDESLVLYLGESLGGAVALALALEFPPKGLILQSTFTSVRDMSHRHYPLIPRAVLPDAYPSLRRIHELQGPLLIVHGENDEIVPLSSGQALFEAAPKSKELRTFPGLGHELVPQAGAAYGAAIAAWVKGLDQR